MTAGLREFGRRWIGLPAAIALVLVMVFGTGLPAAEKKPLADRHKDRGFDCAVCHKEPPPAKVAASSCMVCHGDEAKLAARTKDKNPNPHAMSPLNCENCHSGHK